MHREHIQNILKLSPQERYNYFVQKCADFEELWGLCISTDEWVIFKDQDGDLVFPVWPHKELATICMFPEHKVLGAAPVKIDLETFISECIPDMIENNVYFGVFFDQNKIGLIKKPEFLKRDLLEQYER